MKPANPEQYVDAAQAIHEDNGGIVIDPNPDKVFLDDETPGAAWAAAWVRVHASAASVA